MDPRHHKYEAGNPFESAIRNYYRHLDRELAALRRPRDPALAGFDARNPCGLARVDAIREATRRLVGMIRARWAAAPAALTIELDVEDVRGALGALGEEPLPSELRSAAVFADVVLPRTAADQPTIVLAEGRHYMGFGKYFSRFLHTLSPAWQQRTRADNVQLCGPGEIVAEICGDAHFNANLHPPLLGHEIAYPTGDGQRSACRLSTLDLDVVADPLNAHAVALVHRPTGARVLPVDLGFQNPRRRPPLFQLLQRFMPGGTYGLALPERPDQPEGAHRGDDAPQVVHRPRIVFAGCIVLARRRWTVPGELMPRQAGAETDADFFLRVHQWRTALGIPDEVYMKVRPQPSVPVTATVADVAGHGRVDSPQVGGAHASDDVVRDAHASEDDGDDALEANLVEEGVEDASGTEGAGTTPTAPGAHPPRVGARPRPSRDWLKPQYVSFLSPLLVTLFAKAAVGLRRFELLLEERYPMHEDLAVFGDDRFVTELVLQLDLPADTCEVSSMRDEDGAVAMSVAD
jgi:hypothetical protein